jgi:hypothetical protein
LRFDHLGAWRLRVSLDGALLGDAPLRVVAKTSEIRNRPPFPVTAQVTASRGLAQCTITSPFAVRDPDYDVVSYRYRWTAAGKVLRDVRSAMLSDLVRIPASGRTPRCTVTPSDSKH